MKIRRTDEKFMHLALRLAAKGECLVSPNPMVGCVIVKGGRTVSTGYHREFGGPHAEINAINNAPSPSSVRGSTMYVTLEPCSHTGKKTPPCVPEIIRSGVRRAVIAMTDPNPKESGRGISRLREAGIRCETGLLGDEARKINKAYVKWITRGVPYVILKWAMTLDGKIATRTGDAHWVSSAPSRMLTHKMRKAVDAILVGANTIIRDNPRLTVRLGTGKGKYRNPVRVVLDPHLRVSAGSNVFDGESSSIIFYDRRLLANKYKRKLDILCEKGVDTINVASTNGEFNFSSLMHILGKKGISSVLVEGGGETHALALKYRAADEINAFIAPKIVGGRDAKTPVEGEGIARMSYALLFKGIEVEKVGPDLLIRGYF